MTNELKRLAPAAELAERARGMSAPLAEAASRGRLLDVAYATFDSPVGSLLVAVTPRGLARVAFADEDRDEVLGRLAFELSPRILEAPAADRRGPRELDEYFAGERTRFELRLDRRLIHGIARDVLAATARVPFGATTTYGEIADRDRQATGGESGGQRPGLQPDPDRCAVPPRAASGGRAGWVWRRDRAQGGPPGARRT